MYKVITRRRVGAMQVICFMDRAMARKTVVRLSLLDNVVSVVLTILK